jgi:hypothetical protein
VTELSAAVNVEESMKPKVLKLKVAVRLVVNG